MRIRHLALLLPVATLVLACGPGFDENTGGDGTRGEAREVSVDTLIDDRLSADQGDHSDWKKFAIEGPAKITIRFWWDVPDVGLSVTLRDELGQKIAGLAHARGQREEALGPVKLKEGTYFLEVSSTEGATVYTYEIQAGGAAAPTPDF